MRPVDLSALGLSDVCSVPGEPELLLARWEGRRVRVALEHARLRGREELEARFSRGVLRLRGLVREARTHPDGLVVIRAASCAPSTGASLKRFAEAVAPGIPWIVTDGERPLAPLPSSARGRRAREPRRSGATATGFSDSFLAMTKVVAYRHLPEALIPRNATPWSRSNTERLDAKALVRSAGVSLPQVYRFLSTYEKLGFLRRSAEGPRLVRFQQLARSWATAIAGRRHQFLPATPGRPVRSWLEDRAAMLRRGAPDGRRGTEEPRFALGMHEAAARWGYYGEVVSAPLFLLTKERPEDVLDLLGLRIADPGEERVRIVCPPYPRAVWQGVSYRGPRLRALPVTDVVQTYLDMLGSGGRDLEGAARLEEALEPLLAGEES